MKLTKTQLAGILTGALAISGAASAASVTTIDGITTAVGGYLDIGTLYEGQVTGVPGTNYTTAISAVGQELGGIGIVDALKTSGGQTVWSNGQNSMELSMQFGGFKVEAINTIGSAINILFSGGWANFYSQAAGTFNPSLFPADPNAVASATAGNLWLSTVGATSKLCVAADNCAGGLGTAITLQSTILAGDLFNIGSGVGNGFLDIFGSALANSLFDTNTQPSGQDIALGSSFNSQSSTGSFFASGSMDLRGTVTVPEPTSIALLGMGILAFGLNGRKLKA
ncbi:PEP-CTERM sorting domain-containing protein [Methylomonas albis]|uniref:PEP-CTERM sorting domain-containing protein n=1 Tax=Methylomonas albis TaxID=1854563 RepID=A0ABR9D3N5_9GAMM|nr:PEP-CTERM sorting domain-containing protein [Methylomonas albis]MBD9357737.1 PEP-CTERM sorting domain-containing protein [Methylomonas albis]